MAEPQSALVGAVMTDTYIGIADAGPRGQVTVKGNLTDPAFAAAVDAVAGVAVPDKLSCVSNDTGTRAVWMAPDEILLLSQTYADGASWAASLSEKLAATGGIATNVSDARSILTLTGAKVAEVLSKGAPCDMSETAFPVSTARRTHMAGLAVAFWRVAPESWEIVCLRSFSHHLFAWLEVNAVQGSEL